MQLISEEVQVTHRQKASSTVAVVHRDAHLQNQRTPRPRPTELGDEEEEHHVHVPFPLDHFFFCFFAPVAAGAILTDLLGVRWDVDGWSVDCLERAGRSGRE